MVGKPPRPRPRHRPMNGNNPSSAGCRSGPLRRSCVSSYGYASTGGAFSHGGGPRGLSVSVMIYLPFATAGLAALTPRAHLTKPPFATAGLAALTPRAHLTKPPFATAGLAALTP